MATSIKTCTAVKQHVNIVQYTLTHGIPQNHSIHDGYEHTYIIPVTVNGKRNTYFLQIQLSQIIVYV